MRIAQGSIFTPSTGDHERPASSPNATDFFNSLLSATQRGLQRERQRERYASDAEYRERKRERNRQWHRERYATDPEFRAQRRENARIQRAARQSK